ncbi:MAG: hypothetical protein ACYDCK_12325 [Thermoplasmatota archaeon]
MRIPLLIVLMLATAAVAMAAESMVASQMMMIDPEPANAPTGVTNSSAPTIDDALHHLERHGPIVITSLAAFSPINGVRSGNGSPSNPFVISDIYAPELIVRDVAASYTIRHVYVSGTLGLDWTGPGARVESSFAGFLETNTNTKHHAPATWADIVGDQFGAVRLRHAGGTLTGDSIGPGTADAPEFLSLEVQGYNGLLVANDTVRGPVEFRLHGHHFAGSFADAWMPMDMMGTNATNRYVAISIENNTFIDPSGRGVAISDRAHAANDRTANSEPDPSLNAPHRHFTEIRFIENTIEGAPIVIEDPNARDPRHLPGGETTILLEGNTVKNPLRGFGILIENAHDTNMTLLNNDVFFTGARIPDSTGILVRGRDGGSLAASGGMLMNLDYGVRAERVARDSPWSVRDVAFHDVTHPIWWDDTVATPPTTS